MTFSKQVGLLLWKNLLLQKRKICVTLFEIIMPVSFAFLLVVLRGQIKQNVHPNPTIYDEDDYKRIPENTVIMYFPNNTLINDLMQNAKKIAAASSTGIEVNLRGFPDRKKMILDYHMSNSSNVFGVQFDNVQLDHTVLPRQVNITFRPSSNISWETKLSFEIVQTKSPRTTMPDYSEYGFLYIQYLVSRAVLDKWDSKANKLFDGIDVKVQRMPYPPYTTDQMADLLQKNFTTFIIISLLLTFVQITKELVHEKETKVKESMKLMGMSSASHWMSWIVTSMIKFTVVTTIYIIFMMVKISSNGAILESSDPSLLFFFMICYGIAMTAYACMLSTFLQTATVGAVVATIAYFAPFAPWFIIQKEYVSIPFLQKLALCLDFHLAFALGMAPLSRLEGIGVGARWTNFATPSTVDDNFTMLNAMAALLIDSVLYFAVTWYVDKINPGQFGIPQPWYFPFTTTYWTSTEARTKPVTGGVKDLDPKYFEIEPPELDPGIRIMHLTKVFGLGHYETVAVNDLCLNVYNNQITALLGHNGAGKTTTMSLLTGFIIPTSGTAVINGCDIRADMSKIRSSLGLCPQHNVLFDNLTVLEHLEFFATLKGTPASQVTQEAKRMLCELGLEFKKNSLSKTLSGGTMRKLSVGIALIGGSQIVFLDEPTSGMDPASRRQIWTILQNNREGRTIILTTHFMDEADVLGDRIAIMAKGKVVCCGTSMFLKKLYGTGYHMIIEKEPDCDVLNLTLEIQKMIPTAKLETDINSEATYLLPKDQTGNFVTLFNHLDIYKHDLGIVSCGATATTLDEVFFKVGEYAELYGDPNWNQKPQTSNMDFSPDPQSFSVINTIVQKRGLSLKLSRYKALFIKKAIYAKRNLTMAFLQVCVPISFVVLALLFDGLRNEYAQSPALELSLDKLGVTIVPYSSGVKPTKQTEHLADWYKRLVSTTHKPEKVDRESYSLMFEYFINESRQLGLVEYNRQVMIGVDIDSDHVTAYYNGQSIHTQAVTMAYLMNSVAAYLTLGNQHRINAFNRPLPHTDSKDVSEDLGSVYQDSFVFVVLLSFGMMFLTTSVVFFLIQERNVGAKHLQKVSGVSPFIFWVTHFTWDYLFYLVTSLIMLGMFLVFRPDNYSTGWNFAAVVGLFILNGWAVLPQMYLLQFMFHSPPTGLVGCMIISLIEGILSQLIWFLLQLFPRHLDYIREITGYTMMALIPQFAFGRALIVIRQNEHSLKICNRMNYKQICPITSNPCCKGNCGDFCLPFDENLLAWEVLGQPVLALFGQGVVFMLLCMSIDYNVFRLAVYSVCPSSSSSKNPKFEDSDVAEERRRITSIPLARLQNDDSVILVNLFKRYGSVVSVDHLCLGIPERECFGLLGQNGAGKTTTFKLLTGDVMATSGSAYLKIFSIKKHLPRIYQNLGYCPQFDALIGQMTGRETLFMYARLKGVPEELIPEAANYLMDMLDFRSHANKMTKKYSGGNKRKLSVAITLVGNPSFLLLDEPSTGMDPMARRHLWDVLSQIRNLGKTLILTSHSMDECEALCTRIAIMVNGRFRCLGSLQHLKNKFGQGYTLTVKAKVMPDGHMPTTQHLIKFIKTEFPTSIMFEDHQGYLQFQIADPHMSVGHVFEVLETAKKAYHVEDYSVRQTTLEQVFLAITREQTAPSDGFYLVPNCLRCCCPCW